MYIYSSIAGTFVFNQNFQIREKIIYGSNEDFEKGIKKHEKIFTEKFKNIDRLDDARGLAQMREFKDDLIGKNILITKKAIMDSVSIDMSIIQCICAIDDLTKVQSTLIKRLREWYAYYFPELEREVTDNSLFVDQVDKQKPELMKKFRIKDSMGPELEEKIIEPIRLLADEISKISKLKEKEEKYLDQLMLESCPNIRAVAGSLIGARLIAIAGSLRKLMLFPASTIQLLGAEDALFKHIRKGSKPPKYGILFQHPIVQASPPDRRGKAARAVADKISVGAKIDFFKGEYQGDKLVAGIHVKLK
jgi:nucleolar protein 56